MASETILCLNCGATLRTFMKQCPQCGRVLPPPPPPFPVSAPRLRPVPQEVAKPETRQTEVISLESIRRRAQTQNETAFPAPANVAYLAPPDEERRFPLVTRQQFFLILIGLGMVLFATLIAWLLWARDRRDVASPNAASVVDVQPTPALEPESSPPPELPPPPDDQAILESVKAALTAYNPVGFAGYQFDVKDGIVTLYGVAEHQPEKDGAGNVVRLLAGVKGVINNMAVKPDLAAVLGEMKAPLPETKPPEVVLAPRRRNTPAVTAQPTTPPPTEAPPPPPAGPSTTLRETERQQQEQAARAAEAAREEQRQREAAEAEQRSEAQRQEAARRLEAERRARAEQARPNANLLRSGTVAWSGVVDGVEEIVITGSSASLRHVSGATPREVKTSFSAPLPRAPANVQLLSRTGRSAFTIVQQPAVANGFTTIIRVDDSANNGGSPAGFTLRWTVQ